MDQEISEQSSQSSSGIPNVEKTREQWQKDQLMKYGNSHPEVNLRKKHN